ncbi:MAG TPA: S8 family serine peptidase [Acidimicrobiales bacterium]
MVLIAAIGVLLAASSLAVPSVAEAQSAFSSSSLSAGTTVEGAKSPTSRIARTDPSLLGKTSSTPTAVVVKLDYDSIATYTGGIRGLAPTSPSVTGSKLNANSAAVQAYEAHVAAKESRFVSALQAAVPSARIGQSLRTVYGGVAAVVPANSIEAILAIPGVVAVQRDALAQLQTDSSPSFIGADTLYRLLGGGRLAGQGVYFADLDSGVWPEHPSFADEGDLAPPGPRPDGTTRTCKFGDNPLTPQIDRYRCNNKLIAGEPFLQTYNALNPGEEVYPNTARDSNGHGTHTTTTAAGGFVQDVPVFGVDRGPINGIAPGAYVMAYKVCGAEGCFNSDSAAAVGESIRDGADVINFSISGGTNPYTDVVELAFLDAYAANVFVATSAGNDGPGASTANHLSPWVTTVAASTQRREFQSEVTLTNGETLTVHGNTITDGVGTPHPVVLAWEDPAYVEAAGGDAEDAMICPVEAPPGTFEGEIVICMRGTNARVEKGYNVLQGGAVGMLLINPVVQDTETDNHWLPTVHINQPQGDEVLAYVEAHPDAMATFTAGIPVDGQGDVMAAFSSRGPAGDFLKPDITAPGVQILAGTTPTPESIVEGPPGELFQAIAGTSMSSPHIAGSGILLRALHPSWGPGQIKSALMTTAYQGVVKEDETTPADPFDFGAGRVDLTKAGDPGLTFDESAANYAASATDPLHRIDLNLPSVYASGNAGEITTQRYAQNVTSRALTYNVRTAAPHGASVRVSPSRFTIAPGATIRLDITLSSITLPVGTTVFAEIQLDRQGSERDLHLPVVWTRSQGNIVLDQECADSRINTGDSTTCEVTVTNNSLSNTPVDATTRVSEQLRVVRVTGASKVDGRTVTASDQSLAGRQLGNPTIEPGTTPAGNYLPLDAFGAEFEAIGDEEAINFDLPAFEFAGETFTSLGVTSNGYAVAGGVQGGEDIVCCPPQDMPDPERPNGVIAPFWTDLEGTDAEGIGALILADDETGDAWVVIEWRLELFGTETQEVFQLWLGINGEEDVSYGYDFDNLTQPPEEMGLSIGAENSAGTGGEDIHTVPEEPQRIVSTPGAPGEALQYTLTVRGGSVGNATVRTDVRSPAILGTASEVDTIRVR